MKETGILMVAEMVRQTLAGNKTQTRRVVKPQPKHIPILASAGLTIGADRSKDGSEWFDADCVNPGIPMTCPYGAPGDRLWVRETWAPANKDHPRVRVCYAADMSTWGVCDSHDLNANTVTQNAKVLPGKLLSKPKDGWKPSIFMPRWASRITLEIVSVRVERVQDITEEDAKAEGITFRGTTRFEGEARALFHSLWDSTNAKRGFGWDANPWVWVLEFRRVNP